MAWYSAFLPDSSWFLPDSAQTQEEQVASIASMQANLSSLQAVLATVPGGLTQAEADANAIVLSATPGDADQGANDGFAEGLQGGVANVGNIGGDITSWLGKTLDNLVGSFASNLNLPPLIWVAIILTIFILAGGPGFVLMLAKRKKLI